MENLKNFDPEVLNLIKHFESLHDGDLKTIGLQPKMDPLGIWTEGWGRVIINPSTKSRLRGASNKSLAYRLSSIRTVDQAQVALEEDFIRVGVRPALSKILAKYHPRLNSNQIGALGSLVYNAGTGHPVTYRIFENVQKYLDNKLSAKGLRDYWENLAITGINRFGIRVKLPGLVRRRKEEAKLFFSEIGFYKAPR